MVWFDMMWYDMIWYDVIYITLDDMVWCKAPLTASLWLIYYCIPSFIYPCIKIANNFPRVGRMLILESMSKVQPSRNLTPKENAPSAEVNRCTYIELNGMDGWKGKERNEIELNWIGGTKSSRNEYGSTVQCWPTQCSVPYRVPLIHLMPHHFIPFISNPPHSLIHSLTHSLTHSPLTPLIF